MLSLMDTFFGRLSTTTPRASVLDRLNRAMALHRSRMQLAALEPQLLEDIGIDQNAAAQEAARPVWDAPSTWTR